MNWLKEKTTRAGFVAALLAGVQAYAQEPNILTAIIAALSIVLLVFREAPKAPLVLLFCLSLSGCSGAIEQFTDAHQDDIADLEQCGIRCGVDLAAEALACPINGGSIEDMINAKGLAKDAAQCVLSCMTAKATDIFSEVCKDVSGG